MFVIGALAFCLGPPSAAALTVAVDGPPDLAVEVREPLQRALQAVLGKAEAGEVSRGADGAARVTSRGRTPGRWVLVELRRLSPRGVRYLVHVGGGEGVTFRRGGIAEPSALARRVAADALHGLLAARGRPHLRVAVVAPGGGAAPSAEQAAAWAEVLGRRSSILVPAEELAEALAQPQVRRGTGDARWQAARELLVADAIVVVDVLHRGRGQGVVAATVHDRGPPRGVAIAAPVRDAAAQIPVLLLQAPIEQGLR